MLRMCYGSMCMVLYGSVWGVCQCLVVSVTGIVLWCKPMPGGVLECLVVLGGACWCLGVSGDCLIGCCNWVATVLRLCCHCGAIVLQLVCNCVATLHHN